MANEASGCAACLVVGTGGRFPVSLTAKSFNENDTFNVPGLLVERNMFYEPGSTRDTNCGSCRQVSPTHNPSVSQHADKLTRSQRQRTRDDRVSNCRFPSGVCRGHAIQHTSAIGRGPARKGKSPRFSGDLTFRIESEGLAPGHPGAERTMT